MKILAERTTKFNQFIQLTLRDNGKYRVKMWTEDDTDWDWEEGSYDEMLKFYERAESIDDFNEFV